jgi:hypothetical protein
MSFYTNKHNILEKFYLEAVLSLDSLNNKASSAFNQIYNTINLSPLE